MPTLRRTVAVLTFPVIAWLGAGCADMPTEPRPAAEPPSMAVVAGQFEEPVDLIVDDDGLADATTGDCDALTKTHITIQLAINAASPGQTIGVCPGTYNESPTINKNNITLLGAKAGVPAGPDAIPADRGSDESVVNATAVAGHVIRTNNKGTTIDGFTLNSNPASTSQSGAFIGAMAPGATVENNIINGLAPVPTSFASGIRTASFSGDMFGYNNIDGFRYGMNIDGTPTDAMSSVDANYIANNVFYGVFTNGSVSNGHSFVNNVAEMNDGGILVGQGEHDISGNTLQDNVRFGVVVNAAATNRTFGIDINDNDVLRNGVIGIYFFSDNPDAIDNEAHNNNIVGNGSGLVNQNTAQIDAECNWWGSTTGPRDPDGNPFGTGDASAGNVDYEPWLIAPAPGGQCIGGPLPPSGKVTGGGQIDVANGKGSFGHNAKLEDGAASGHLNYLNHFTRVHLNCTVTAFIVLTTTEAMFTGTCSSKSYTGDFTAEVEDNGEPGKNNDVFRITYGSPLVTEGGPLRSGNIQIHQ